MKKLKTSYEEVGNILRQKIDFSGAMFPLIADICISNIYTTRIGKHLQLYGTEKIYGMVA